MAWDWSGPRAGSPRHGQKPAGLGVLGEGGRRGCLRRDGGNAAQDLPLWFLSVQRRVSCCLPGSVGGLHDRGARGAPLDLGAGLDGDADANPRPKAALLCQHSDGCPRCGAKLTPVHPAPSWHPCTGAVGSVVSGCRGGGEAEVGFAASKFEIGCCHTGLSLLCAREVARCDATSREALGAPGTAPGVGVWGGPMVPLCLGAPSSSRWSL